VSRLLRDHIEAIYRHHDEARIMTRAFAVVLCWLGCGGALGAGWTASLPNGQSLNIVERSTSTRSGYFLERRYPDGARDRQFGEGGRAFLSMANENGAPTALQVDALGRILVAGMTPTSDGRSAAAVLRLLPGGQPDTTWGQAGQVSAVPQGANATVADVLPLSGGKVLVIGTIDDAQTQRVALWRFSENGQLDVDFAANGMLLPDSLPQSQGLSIQQVADGTLHIAVQTRQAGKVWLEMHRWGIGDVAPQRVARQEFPDQWVGPAVLKRGGATWFWFDGAQPEISEVKVRAVAPDSPWKDVSERIVPEVAGPRTGHAVLNPFVATSRDVGDDASILGEGLFARVWVAAAFAMIGGVLWWSRRRWSVR
jgi:uncharacterized delta-60 repeat protein